MLNCWFEIDLKNFIILGFFYSIVYKIFLDVMWKFVYKSILNFKMCEM